MNLLHLSKRERFYFDVGEAIAMNNTRSLINLETLQVEFHLDKDSYDVTGVEEMDEEILEDSQKYLLVETIGSREAFTVMEEFVQTVKDKQMQQRLTNAINGKKPFAHFNHLVHTTDVRERWFEFKGKAYAEMAKAWIEHHASQELKEKIKALPAVRAAT